MSTIKYYCIYFKNLFINGFFNIFFNRKKFKEFSVITNDFHYNYNLISKTNILKSIDALDLFKTENNIEDVKIEKWNFRQGNVTLNELYILCLTAKLLKPKIIFEIGTFDGRTTLHLAVNTVNETKIHTLDLPPEKLNEINMKLDPGDLQLITKSGFRIGECFLNRVEKEKIIQHFGDSAKFDFSEFNKKVELFFIDGAHSYNYVKTDTENALKSLTPNGIIFWHDYSNVADVAEYLNKLNESLNIYRIQNTSLAVYSPAFKI
ncbi:MAG: class I SAM-dependent methyltransferase [Ignavibacteria bacterium]|nr:class I SAM-dependent methyltransferase [Ignavibacteria bacterium]